MKTHEMIEMNLINTAEWRRQKAAEYPEDAIRNFKAATTCEALASEFAAGDYDKGMILKYAELAADEDAVHDLSEAERDVIGRIGFQEFPENADDLLDSILHRMGEGVSA